jgi:hypothetical protein
MIIYQITNTVTSDFYVGKTINPKNRFYQHKYNATKRKSRTYLHRAMRKYGVDCTRLLRYIFLNMLHLPYNSSFSSEPIISSTFANTLSHSNTQLKNFTRIPKTTKGFKPQTGDILAFPGHTIAVLDPKNCIAIQSSIWLCKKIQNGFCVDAEYGNSAGVSIYHLASDRLCKNGIWKGMDSKKLNFTVGWRHRAFDTWIKEMPEKTFRHSRMTLIGKNLVGKFIYFTGSNQPIRTKLLKYLPSGLQSVTLITPKNATSGYLKIYWGTGQPNIENTVDSYNKIIILEKKARIAEL